MCSWFHEQTKWSLLCIYIFYYQSSTTFPKKIFMYTIRMSQIQIRPDILIWSKLYVKVISRLVLIFMPQTLKKLKGHIALGLSVRPNKINNGVLKFLRFLNKQIIDLYFVSILDYLPLWSYATFKGL